MIPYGRQHIDRADVNAVVRVLRSDWLTQGPMVPRFENALARYCGAKYAVVFSSGTAALHGAYFAAGLGVGDECITSPLTFAATANAALYLGARPVFADVDEYGNLDSREAEKRMNKKTKALVAVDYGGVPADLRALKRLAKRQGLVFIEDACHALGATYRGKRIGSIADLTVFSFHPVKSITTGEGGAVLTHDKKYYDRLQTFRTHGLTKDPSRFEGKSPGDWYMEMQSLGFNYRLTDMQAALGLSQMKKLPRFIAARRRLAARYGRDLADLSSYLILPYEKPQSRSSWHLYVVRLKDVLIERRSAIFAALRRAGIGAQVHYIPVYHHPYYQTFGYTNVRCPRAEEWYASAISLPIFPDLTDREQSRVIAALRRSIRQEIA